MKTPPQYHIHKNKIHASKFKHGILKISILLMLCLSLIIPASAATFSGGSGTIEDPFQLSSDSDIDTLSASSGYWGNQYNFILTQDITLVGNHTPIGNINTKFTGNFNGSGFAVKNLTVYQAGDYAGFFGSIGSGANIHDIGVEISSEGVTGNNRVGGLVGYNYGGTVNNSYATGNVTGSANDVGGLVGYNYGGTVNNSYATGNVTGGASVGGLVGYNPGGTVTNSYATGNVTGNDRVGGLVGFNKGGTVNNSYATGNVTGGASVGGLVGYNDGTGTVTNSYATGNVTGSSNDVGGLVGVNVGNVSNSYATGSVTGDQRVGGLVGYNIASLGDAYVTNCFATGNVSSGDYVGALVGQNIGGTVNNSYYSGSPADSYGGISTSYANFTSFAFVSGNSGLYWNESGNNITTADDSGFVWKMVESYTLPYFQYQDMPAPIPYVESISVNSGINNNAGSTSFLLNVTGCSFNITDTVFVNLTMAGQTPINGTINSITYTTINTTFDLTQAIAGDWSLYVINPDGQTSIAKNFTISAAPYSGGSGTLADPYLLSTDSDIDDLSATSADWGSYFELTNDITLTGNHTPIGNGSTQFTGNFNGSGFAIQNLTVYQTGNYAGFFGYAGSGANIHDLGIEISSDGVVSTASYVGGLVGYNRGIVSNSYATGNITGGNSVGGLVGHNYRTVVTNSYTTNNVNGVNSVGGLVGYNNAGTVSNSYSTGSVIGSGFNVGGLVGWNDATTVSASVTNCFATGTVTGSQYVGGLVGYNHAEMAEASVINCFATGTVTGSSPVGGLVGYNYAQSSAVYVTNSYYSGSTADTNGGISTSYANFTNFAFVSGSSGLNWNESGNVIITADDSGFVWKIIDGYTLPYFQYQDMPAPLAPYVVSISPSNGFNNTDGSTSFRLNVTGCSFNITDTVFVNLTMDGQTPINGTIDSRTYTTINTIFNLTQAIAGDWSLYVINPDGQTSIAKNFIVQSLFIPGTPESFTNTTGNFWVNHSWNAGTGDVSDSYNISYNGTWLNGTINSFNHTGLSAHAWSNITVYAYNTTDSTISLGTSDNVQIPNNAVSILNVTDITVYEGENVTFDINFTDADGDTPVFGCNNSALFDSFNTSTGEGSWVTDLSDAGTYYVEFNVSDGYGSVDSQVMTITINDVIIPVADINADITMGPYPLSVQFTDNSSNIPTDWFWDFGDGTNSTLQNPATHIYSDAGIYNVSLNASNLAGSDLSSNMTITVTRPGTPESFTNTTGNFWVNHSWNAGTGDVSDSYNVSYNGTWLNGTINSFNHTGLSAHAWSNITVYAYNATDSTISLGASDNVQVSNNAVSILNVTDITVSEGENVTFDINFTDADSDTPVFASNNSSLFDSFNTSTGEGLWITGLSDAGTYYVEFNVSDGYGSVDSQVMNITINDVIIPVADINADVVTGPYPLSVQFTDNSSNIPTAWFWDFGDGTNSTLQNPATHTYNVAGIYNVSLNASNLAGSDLSSNMTITVTRPGTPESFTNTTGNFWVNHSWNAGTGDVSDSYNVSYNGTWLNGTINSFNHTGLSAHAWSNITVYAYNVTDSTISAGASDNVQIPNNAVSILNVTDITVYEGENVTFDINFTDVDGDTPVFDCNRSSLFDTFNTSTGEGLWITDLSDAGTYYVEFNVSDGYGSVDSQVMNITINDVIIPVADINVNTTIGHYPLSVQFTDNSSNIPTAWFWDFGDGTNSTLQNPPAHTYNVAGIYNVSLNASNLAGSDLSNNVTITVTRPGTPESFTNTSGNFWVNHSWNAGAGDVSDSYNVSYNGTWLNGTINSFNHIGLSAHAWSNITVYAYNATDSTLSAGASDNVQIPNNAVSILNVTNITVYEGENITFDINSTDADGDIPTFDCNNSALFDTFNTSTGEGLWITDISDAGTYYVEFNVSDGYGSVDSQVMAIIINDTIVPVADFSANTVTGYAPLSVQFTDNSSNIPNAWFWDFGDGTNSSLQNPPVHTYNVAGIYNVSLNASNFAGSNLSSNMTITVTTAPSSGSSRSGGSGSSGSLVIGETDESNEPGESTGEANTEEKSTKHIESVSFETDTGGKIQSDVTVWSNEETAYLRVNAGTKVTGASGGSVHSIRIVDIPVSDVPAATDLAEMDDTMTLHAYECTPDGTTFSPAISLTFTLSEEEWKQYGESAKVGWYNDDTGEWEVIQGTADASTRTITIQVSHFSTYALFGDDAGETVTGRKDADAQSSTSSWLWILLLLTIVGGAVYYFTQVKKKE